MPRLRLTFLTAALVLCGPAVVPAQAYKWPGDGASPGGAIAAKVIGTQCPGVISRAEMGELDQYLARAGAELTAKYAAEDAGSSPFQYDEFKNNLTATYEKQYEGGACDESASEEARDMLQRVRVTMASNDQLFPPEDHPTWRPDIADAMSAKLTAEKCRDALTAVDVAELQLYIAKVWMRWVKSSSDPDARATQDIYSKVAVEQEREWSDASCTASAIKRAHHILTVVRKSPG